jgi:nuclear transport factor 2 (NTF2) superfamily protein
MRMTGRNVVAIVQLTPYLQPESSNDDGILVVQTRVWFEDADGDVHRKATLNSVPLHFGEKLYYYPLGDREEVSNAYIEICLEFH